MANVIFYSSATCFFAALRNVDWATRHTKSQRKSTLMEWKLVPLETTLYPSLLLLMVFKNQWNSARSKWFSLTQYIYFFCKGIRENCYSYSELLISFLQANFGTYFLSTYWKNCLIGIKSIKDLLRSNIFLTFYLHFVLLNDSSNCYNELLVITSACFQRWRRAGQMGSGDPRSNWWKEGQANDFSELYWRTERWTWPLKSYPSPLQQSSALSYAQQQTNPIDWNAWRGDWNSSSSLDPGSRYSCMHVLF